MNHNGPHTKVCFSTPSRLKVCYYTTWPPHAFGVMQHTMKNDPASNRLRTIRSNLRRLMEEHDIGAKPLAQRAGLGETSVRDFLKNDHRDIQVGTLVRIAEVFGATLEDLVAPAPGKHIYLPNDNVLMALTEGILSAIPTDASPHQKARILAQALQLGLRLLADLPAIHHDEDAIRAMGGHVAEQAQPSIQ